MITWRWWRRTPPAPLIAQYQAATRPAQRCDYREIEYVALDFETTGLDARHDRILSVGWVRLVGQRILLASAQHHVIRIERAIPAASAVIHHITDDQAARGQLLTDVLELLLPVLAGRVLIAHYADIERDFLRQACRRFYGTKLTLPQIIDTQLLAQRRFERHHIVHSPADLRLYALAARYNLPRLIAHNALSDALTTAELFLALTARPESAYHLPLRELLC